MILAVIAVTAPAIEVIVVAEIVEVGCNLISSSEGCALIGVHGEGLTASRYFAFAATDGDDRRVARLIDFEAIVTRPKKIESEVRRVYFDDLILVEMAQVNAHDAFTEADLSHVVR